MSSSAAPKKIWSILDLITWGTEYLTEKNIDDARLTIELMLAHILLLKRIQLYTKFDQPLSEVELSRFKELLKRRLNREPLQYILGETEFMGLKFSVDRRVLIPRPETELLVEKAVELVKQQFTQEQSVWIMDIGTGSGCIAVTIAKMIPSADVIALDVSKEALDLSQQNAEQNGVMDKISFHQIDMIELIAGSFNHKFHCILSNPPYISENDFKEVSPEIEKYEPHIALTDNGNGLKYFPAIARFAKESLIENGIVGVEHAFGQSESVRKIFLEYGFSESMVVKDFQKIERHLFFTRS